MRLETYLVKMHHAFCKLVELIKQLRVCVIKE